MKKPVMSVEVPAPRAVTHRCGAPAVEESYFSARAGAVVQVVICSKCDASFYPKAAKLLSLGDAA